jgi:hypothetical protein
MPNNATAVRHGPIPKANEERLWGQVVKTEGCWLWTAGHRLGYGVFHVRDSASGTYSTVQAHRYIYEQLVGLVPYGLQLDHLCRNRLCVNPSHLEPVTIQQNVLRGMGLAANNSKKTHCLRGHPFDLINTRSTVKGKRVCRLCDRIRHQSYKQREEGAS